MKNTVKLFITIFTLLLGLAATSLAENNGKKKDSKSKFNTDLFEKQEGETSVSGKVKVLREVQEETEVFLESKGNSGPYVLPQNLKGRAKMVRSLQKSQKPGGPSVTIGIDDQQRIKSVEESEASSQTHPEWEF